ncbi:hypothetical protein BU17DRAFT_82810 [Hysterangium stoloniferum]|nr:hypothetical protein BU17DRAFT_82810 [Hysterangium stoloniferum]
MYALFNDISEDAIYPNQRFSPYDSYDLQGLSPQSACSHAAHPDFNHCSGVHGGALNALRQEDPCQWFLSQGPPDERYPLGAPTFDTGDTHPQFVYPPDLSGLVSPNDWLVPSTLNSQYNQFVPSTLNSRYNQHLHSEERSRMRLDNIIASFSAPPGVNGHGPSYGQPVPSGLDLPSYQHFHTREDRSRMWLRNTEAPLSALLPGINQHSYQCLATVLDHPLRHWVVHVRDELRAISNNTIELCDGRIVTTDHKHRIAEQYLTHFCPNPACHQTWSRADQVRTHIKNSRECSLLAYCGGCEGCGECPNCLAGDAQCQNCKYCAIRRRQLISGAYPTIAKELGYVPPARLDRIFILEEEAQEQELEERSTLDEEDDGVIV